MMNSHHEDNVFLWKEGQAYLLPDIKSWTPCAYLGNQLCIKCRLILVSSLLGPEYNNAVASVVLDFVSCWMLLALGLLLIVFVILRCMPCIHSFFRDFMFNTLDVGLCQRSFLHLMRGSCGFCYLVCLCGRLCLLIYVY